METQKVKNPFVLYGYISPEYFCDREQETEELISALQNGRNITLMSPRRMGKTGLISHIFRKIKEENTKAYCFYLDIFSTKSLENFVRIFSSAVIGKLDTPRQRAEGFISKFFQGVRLVLSNDVLTGMPQLSIDFEPSQTQTTLEQIFAYLKQSNKECFIAIDEFQQILTYPEEGVEALLRSQIQFCPNVHFIFSGSKQHLMTDIFTSAERPFYQSTEKMTLHAIDEEKYYQFAESWMSSGKIKFSQDIFHTMYERFNGHTWYMQYLLNVLYEMKPKSIKQEDINIALSHIITKEEDGFQNAYDKLTLNQAKLLSAIAHEKNVKEINAGSFIHKYQLKGTSSVNKALEYLISKEFVYRTSEGYIVYNRFFSIWLERLGM